MSLLVFYKSLSNMDFFLIQDALSSVVSFEKNVEGSIELRSTSAWGCLRGEERESLQGCYCPRHSTTH